MTKYKAAAWQGKHLFIGIDMHRKRWHVTIRSEDGLMLFSSSIEGSWMSLQHVLDHFRDAARVSAVYEAGYFGFWLYDHLVAYGVEARVTPPSLIPQASGNRVKTDRLDSNKLAQYLQADLLKAIYVPTPQERAHRQLARRRRQLIGDRTRVQNRIKAELRFNGLNLPRESTGKWSQVFVTNLHAIRFTDRYQQASFQSLLDQFDFLSEQLDQLKDQLYELSQTKDYQERIDILTSIPGIGWLSALEILLELQDVARFQRAEQLAAYVGLTPEQHSSGEQVRLGRITRQGKGTVRTLLIQAAWRLIAKDPVMADKYDRIKKRSGSKRAIVAVARTLLLRMRCILMDRQPYVCGLLAG